MSHPQKPLSAVPAPDAKGQKRRLSEVAHRVTAAQQRKGELEAKVEATRKAVVAEYQPQLDPLNKAIDAKAAEVKLAYDTAWAKDVQPVRDRATALIKEADAVIARKVEGTLEELRAADLSLRAALREQTEIINQVTGAEVDAGKLYGEAPDEEVLGAINE